MAEFRFPNRVIFARDASSDLADIVAELPRPILLLTGSNPSRFASVYEPVTGIEAICAVSGEPTVDRVAELTALSRSNSIASIIAIGGGSVIDMAKAVAALTPNAGEVLDYLEVIGLGKPLETTPLPICAVPTTAGTGAEMTKNGVICSPEKQRKVSIRHHELLPKIAVIDPRLTDMTPRSVTLSCGLDALTQVIEPYISCKANFFSDSFAKLAIPMGLDALLILAEREDPEARDKLAWVSVAGGTALANSGLGIVHGIAGVMGGWTKFPHGAICGALLPQALIENELQVTDEKIVKRINWLKQQIADRFNCTSDNAFVVLQAWVRANLREIPAKFGLDELSLQCIAEQSLDSSSTKGNPVVLPVDRILRIINSV